MAFRYIFKEIILKQRSILFINKVFHHSRVIKNYNNFKIIKLHVKFTRSMSDTFYNSDTEQIEYEEPDVDEHDNTDKYYIRNLLYPESKDPLILQFKECASVENVFTIIRKEFNNLEAMHVNQAILVLWDLQKIFYKHNMYFENDTNTKTVLTANAIIQNYMNQINSHEDFERLIQLVDKFHKEFNVNALTCTLLYLNRMGVKLSAEVMQKMVNRCKDEIKAADQNTFPLTSLSRFIVTISHQTNFYQTLISLNIISTILNRLDKCDSESDFKLITICLFKVKHLLTAENMEKYKEIGENLIDNKIITEDHPRSVIKALRFLTQPQWFDTNIKCTNKFMHILKGNVYRLSTRELIPLFKVFQIQKEPADMLDEIQQHAFYLLSELEDDTTNSSLETILELLSCVASFSSPLQRPKYENLFRKYINNNITPDTVASLYKILYHIKSADKILCDLFWNKSLEFITQRKTTEQTQLVLNLCSKYIHFCRNINNAYKHYKFQNSVNEYFINELKFNQSKLTTSQFSIIASFLLAYSDDYNYLENLLDQLIDKMNSLNLADFLNISKVLQIASENILFRTNDNLKKKYQLLNSALNSSSSKEFENTTKLSNVNLILRNYIYRKEVIEEGLLRKILNLYVVQSNELTSHMIRDTSFYLQMNNYLEPEVINILVNYIIKNKENVLGMTADKVLHLCYTLGFTPDNHNEFLNITSEIIVRDKERFTGLTFLQSCLALCYFHSLPSILTKQIFSVEFLEKLDEELSNCYAKTTYPARVRDYVMQLNRAVCLDYPDSNVPWFHQKYVDETKKHVTKKGFFQKQVHSILLDVIKDTNNELTENVFSPYGYRLDFELKYNNINNKKTDSIQGEKLSRAAIILLNSKAYSNHVLNLKGYYQLKQRHLEMLGYNFIGINFHEWKLFCDQQSCMDYIKNKIWPKILPQTSLAINSR